MNGQRLIKQVLCVALVAALMVPAGQWIFPYVSAQVSGLQFEALEALASAALGFGIFTIIG